MQWAARALRWERPGVGGTSRGDECKITEATSLKEAEAPTAESGPVFPFPPAPAHVPAPWLQGCYQDTPHALVPAVGSTSPAAGHSQRNGSLPSAVTP